MTDLVSVDALSELLDEFADLPPHLVVSVLKESGGRVITASRRLAELVAGGGGGGGGGDERSASRPSAGRPRAPPGFEGGAPPPQHHPERETTEAAAVAAASAFAGGAASERLAAGVLDFGPAVTPEGPAPLSAATSAAGDVSWPSSAWSTPARPYGGALAGAPPQSPADIAGAWGVGRSSTVDADVGAGPGERMPSLNPWLADSAGDGGGGAAGAAPPRSPRAAAGSEPLAPSFDWTRQRAALLSPLEAAAAAAAAAAGGGDAAARTPTGDAASPGWQGDNPFATAAAVLDDDGGGDAAGADAAAATTTAADLPPPRLVILVGLPGAGKAAAADALASAGWSVVAVDDAPSTLARRAAEVRLTGHLFAGRSAVLVGVNARRADRAPWIAAARAAGAAVHALELRTPLDVCEARTRAAHPDMRPRAAARVVRQWAEVLEACRRREGFESVTTTAADEEVAAAAAGFGRAVPGRTGGGGGGGDGAGSPRSQRTGSMPRIGSGVSSASSSRAGSRKVAAAKAPASRAAPAPPPQPASAPIPVPPSTPAPPRATAKPGNGNGGAGANGTEPPPSPHATIPSSPPPDGDLSAVDFLTSALNVPESDVVAALAACNGSEAGALDLLLARFGAAEAAPTPPPAVPSPPTDAAGRLAALFPCMPRSTVLSALRAAAGDEADAAGRLCDFLAAGAGGDGDAPQSPVETLASLFPSIPADRLEAALRAEDGNVDAAAAALADEAERADAEARSEALARELAKRSPSPDGKQAAAPGEPPPQGDPKAVSFLVKEFGATAADTLDALAAADGDAALASYLLRGDGTPDAPAGRLPPGVAGTADKVAHALALEAGATDARALDAVRAAGGWRARAAGLLTGAAPWPDVLESPDRESRPAPSSPRALANAVGVTVDAAKAALDQAGGDGDAAAALLRAVALAAGTTKKTRTDTSNRRGAAVMPATAEELAAKTGSTVVAAREALAAAAGDDAAAEAVLRYATGATPDLKGPAWEVPGRAGRFHDGAAAAAGARSPAAANVPSLGAPTVPPPRRPLRAPTVSSSAPVPTAGFDASSTSADAQAIYADARADARAYAKAARDCRDAATALSNGGQYKAARAAHAQADELQAKAAAANAKARDDIVRRVNARTVAERPIDLHGMHADEAVAYLVRTLKHELANPEDPLVGTHLVRVMTGRGRHSRGGAPSLVPAVETLAARCGLLPSYCVIEPSSKGGVFRITLPPPLAVRRDIAARLDAAAAAAVASAASRSITR